MLNKQAAMVLGIVAAALVLLGLIVGFSPTSPSGYDCGSAFSGADAPSYSVKQACDEARSDRQMLAWGSIGVGALLGIGSFAMSQATVKQGAGLR